VAINICKPDCTRTGACTSREARHAGYVLGSFERNGYDDSDFMAAVWEPTAGEIIAVEYASTRGWSYHNTCVADATEDVKHSARAWLVRKAEHIYLARARRDVSVGLRVRSLTTRGKNKGREGIAQSIAPSSYGYDKWRVKIVGDDGSSAWMDLNRVEVVDAEFIKDQMGKAYRIGLNGLAREYHALIA